MKVQEKRYDRYSQLMCRPIYVILGLIKVNNLCKTNQLEKFALY